MRLLDRLKKVNLLSLLKMGIGSAAAILLADSLGFLYSPSAGIITLLTIQNTKKDTLTIALKRFIAFLLASFISYAVFETIGYNPAAFGAFVFLFVAVCHLTGLTDAVSMNAVLMTHFLIEKHMGLPLILNELGLLIIGMGIGILLNMLMPSKKKQIRREQLLLEEEIKKALHGLAGKLKAKEGIIDFLRLEAILEQLLKSAYAEAGNTLLSDTRYLVSYLEMRKLQLSVLKDVEKNMEQVPVTVKQAFPIAYFIENIASSFHELNNAEGLLHDLEMLKDIYRKEKLPQTREEFEYRAVLFQILKELEYFLLLKRNFVHSIEEKNMKSYWNE